MRKEDTFSTEERSNLFVKDAAHLIPNVVIVKTYSMVRYIFKHALLLNRFGLCKKG
ncbi:hypothetical protein GXN76_04290 [Kroppenstedtia pulmonis]|uniref:Uncharacterized protein n=1 Tax=Kroppenstedtia pulmonis TaxID=1380685 RepID=A0A7D4BVA3_9BACL|nr:hypothetical protein [Kroppenstedtia pulmonis]QKG83773.1 hypothetical protein GXN76_04290 [Kroppenstedtia pulmonis]